MPALPTHFRRYCHFVLKQSGTSRHSFVHNRCFPTIHPASAGNPSIVYLDEPTTGLDPETRQGVWKIIERAKKDRAIILTTHSMEEADALCSRIGIMANGELRCIGTQVKDSR